MVPYSRLVIANIYRKWITPSAGFTLQEQAWLAAGPSGNFSTYYLV